MCTMNESREESDDIISITSDEMAAAAAAIEQTVKQREEEFAPPYSSGTTLHLFRRVSLKEVSHFYFYFLLDMILELNSSSLLFF